MKVDHWALLMAVQMVAMMESSMVVLLVSVRVDLLVDKKDKLTAGSKAPSLVDN